jgi:hypothetical protein
VLKNFTNVSLITYQKRFYYCWLHLSKERKVLLLLHNSFVCLIFSTPTSIFSGHLILGSGDMV